MNEGRDNIMVIIIFSMLCIPTFSMGHELPFDLEDSHVFKKIFRDIIVENNIHDTAILISDFSSTKSVLIDSIIELTMNNNLPMICMASNVSSARNLQSSCYMNSNTLLLYIYKSKDLSSFMKIEDISDIVLHNKLHPKLLFLAVLEDAQADFQALLHYMWTKYILDVTVLDVTRRNGISIFTVHQYNPFSKKYTNQPYSSSVNWFPNKLRNLHGYPIKMNMISRLGYNVMKAKNNPNFLGYVKKHRGYDSRVLETLKSLMNFSDTIMNMKEYDPSRKGKNITMWEFVNIELVKHVDTLVTTLPLVESARRNTVMAEGFTSENWCVLMPVLYRKSNLEYSRMMRIMLSLIMITIFWLVSVILKFKSRSWRMMNVFGMVISYTTHKFKIVAWSERILFLSLVLVSAMHSSKLYADLTTSNVGGREEIQLENFRDLLAYGLTPIFHADMFEMNFKDAEGDFLEVKAKAKTMNSTFMCSQFLLKHGNVSCFMESRSANTLIAMQRNKSRRELTVNQKLCYWTPPSGYYFYKYSPYISRVADIMLRSQQVGLSQKWFTEYFDEISPGYLEQTKKKRKEKYGKTAGTKVKVFIVVTCGYLISILVFFGELIIHRLERH